MRWKGWEKVPLAIPDPGVPGGTRTVSAAAPVIVSASRSTDIPAFYGDWFMSRIRDGRVTWKSPFGGDPVYVSFARTRLFVFWSKNPAPFLSHLDDLDRSGYRYYFLFTLNDYEREGLEPHLPPLDERIATFIRLSQMIGKGRVVWRFDPLVVSDRISVDDLLAKVRHVGDRIAPFTKRLVFSFVDIARYRKVQRNLNAGGCSGAREFTEPEIHEFCSGLAEFNREWGLEISACAENRNLLPYGIRRGQCISYDLMVREFADDPALMQFLRPGLQSRLDGTVLHTDPEKYLRDPGQRSVCRCIVSKDIGQYSTCPHLCAYCYANTSRDVVCRNYSRYCEARDRGIFFDSITG